MMINTAIAGASLLFAATAAFADAGHGTGPDIGQAGDISVIDRVIEVEMGEMFFSPEDLRIESGETIRFVVSNTGRMVHEFNLGTDEMHDGHGAEMRKMMQGGMMNSRKLDHAKMREEGMMHDDANSVLLEPGETAEIVWTFSGDAELSLACNVPGHCAAGMVGGITLVAPEAS